MSDEIARRTIVQAAWAAPVVVLAVAAPGAAASTTTPLELISYNNPLNIPVGQTGDTLPLLVRNRSASPVTATVAFVLTGMSADGFRAEPLPPRTEWTVSETGPFGPITFTWSGTLAPDAVGTAQNVTFNYAGSAPRPVSATFECTSGDAVLSSLTLVVNALGPTAR
jgi:hypothetical protein